MAHVLDTLLVNYDKRVRPDVGGETLGLNFIEAKLVKRLTRKGYITHE